MSDLQKLAFAHAGTATKARTATTLLPDPEPRAATYTIISVDDHLVEPRDLFEGRLPSHLADRAPYIVEEENGAEVWMFEGQRYPQIGLNAVAGRPKEQWTMEAARFDEMRPGCYDIHARIKDMDLAGIWGSICFPSLIAGFAGGVFSRVPDAELGLACVRAWNDWHHEEWAGPYPDRIIPLQIPWLGDPLVGAEEIRRNADRGFKAVSFPEMPARLGLPSLHSGAWDPYLAACEETQTVVCLHTGSASWMPLPADDPPFELFPVLFPVSAYLSAADWLWSRVPLRFPNLSIAMSEGGLGWVTTLADRSDYVLDHSASGTESRSWYGDLRPSEVLRRNFYFCSIDDPHEIEYRHAIGIDHIMVESDYPHADSSWPDTQTLLQQRWGTLPPEEVDLITHLTAARLFRHPLPPGSVSSEGSER